MAEELKAWQKIRRLRRELKKISREEFVHLPEEEKGRILRAQRAERLFTYRYDFHSFCLEVLNAESWGQVPCKWSQLHKDLCRFIRSCKNLNVSAFVMIPRYHLKTQICTIFYRIWRLVHDPELCSLIISGTLELSKSTARTVRAEIEGNPKIRDLYAHVLPDWIFNDRKNKWSETQFNVARTTNYPQCTIEAVGVEATITGKHFGEISIDDIVTPENSTTPEQCEKVVQAYKYFLSILNPKVGRIVLVGTPYTDNDLYTYLRDPEIIKTFKFFIRPVYDSNLAPIWPDMFTVKKLREIAISQGTYTFSAQYLLDPVPAEQQEFKSSWIQTYLELPKDLNGNEIYVTKYILVDPITAKPTSSTSKDRGVILVVGVDKASNWYALDYKLYARAKESELFRDIFLMSDKWNTKIVGWETVAYQLQGKNNLEEEAKRTGHRLDVKELRPGHTKKEVRIRALIPYFERGQIFIKRWMIELISELQRFPFGATLDIIDALAYMIQLIPARRTINFNNHLSTKGQANKPWYF